VTMIVVLLVGILAVSGFRQNLLTETLSATFYPKIVRAADAQIAVQDSYSGNASETACAGASPLGPIIALKQEARDDALAALRKDIAPYARSMDATVLTNFCTGGMGDRVGGLMRGGPCDDSAPSANVIALVEGGEEFAKQGRLDRACEQWSKAENLHSEGFIMPYLLGVCAELASNNIPEATAFYRQADSQTTRPVKVIGEALDRVELKADATGIQARSTASQGRSTASQVRKPNPEVLAVQEALVDLGYEPGSADGFIGAQTRKALQFYQEDMGLDVTGTVDGPTKQELGVSTLIAN
ncbi:peptidoglycan-binding protein, partial [bacterium]|nr:peptidoglycan-binding protein [bacterium]